MRVQDTDTVTKTDTSTRKVSTPDNEQNKAFSKGLKKPANQYTDLPEAELTIIKEMVEEQIEKIEKGVKTYPSEKDRQYELNLFKEQLSLINAEFARRNGEPKLNLKT